MTVLERLRSLLAGPAGSAPAAGPETDVPAATAALLLEMAWADEDLAAPERDAVRELLARRYDLDAAALDELLALAERRRRETRDHFAVTRLLRERLDHRGRLAVLRDLWRVVYADGVLDPAEDALIHKLARLLDVSHRELIALKLSVRDG